MYVQLTSTFPNSLACRMQHNVCPPCKPQIMCDVTMLLDIEEAILLAHQTMQ